MPIYGLYDSESEKEFDVFMSYSSLEAYLSENPHIIKVPCAPAIVSGVGGIKTDDGFKEMIGKIAKANPYTPLGQKEGSKGVTETKLRNAVNRVKSKVGVPLN